MTEKTIDDAESIELGRFLNSTSSTVRPHSLAENINTCISYARAQRARNGKIDSKEVTALSLAHSICHIQLLGKKSAQKRSLSDTMKFVMVLETFRLRSRCHSTICLRINLR